MVNDNKFGFGRVKATIMQVIKPELPKQVAQLILLHFRTNYNREGYDNKTFIPWKKRKYAVNRKLLVKTGALRDGIYIKQQTFGKIVIGNDVPYFEYHNNGTPTLPQRPIIYESQALDKKVEKLIEEQLNKLFR